MIEIRPVETDADFEAYVEVRNRIHPETPITVEQVRGNPAGGKLDVVAYLDGEPVGAGSTSRQFDDPAAPVAYASARVLREHRRRGIGSSILEVLSRHARADGRSALYVVVRLDDEDSRSYYGNRGFEEVLRMEEVRLRPAESGVQAGSVDGLRIVRLMEELDRAVYEAAQEIEPDLPAGTPVAVLAFEEWHARNLGPLAIRECSFAALDGDVVAGYAILGRGAEDAADHWMTGTRRAYRGRGVARSLKQCQIAASRAAGIRELRTTNASDNLPMRRVNEGLGYRPSVTWVHLRGPLVL